MYHFTDTKTKQDTFSRVAARVREMIQSGIAPLTLIDGDNMSGMKVHGITSLRASFQEHEMTHALTALEAELQTTDTYWSIITGLVYDRGEKIEVAYSCKVVKLNMIKLVAEAEDYLMKNVQASETCPASYFYIAVPRGLQDGDAQEILKYYDDALEDYGFFDPCYSKALKKIKDSGGSIM